MSTPLPAPFVDRLRQLVPPSAWEPVLASFVLPKWAAYRINPLRADVQAAHAQLQADGLGGESLVWLPGAYRLPPEQRPLLVRHPLVDQGVVYVQNPSSMLAVVALDPRPGESVLDLAAAPGGKTLLMAARMENQGSIAAVEAVRSRYYKLQANLARGGVRCARTYWTDGRTVAGKTGERFDRVLLDAPCSAEARFHADRPGSWSRWGERKIREQARKQVGLLRSGLGSLRPGGTLLYCTCSLAPEENEAVVDRQLDRFGDRIRIEPLELPVEGTIEGRTEWQGRTFSPHLRLARRILPNAVMDALFLCKLIKLQSTVPPRSRRGMIRRGRR